MISILICFYPCFNGIRVGTEEGKEIFIVEEISFYPCFNGIRVGTQLTIYTNATMAGVSILVLMELGLEHQ